jgi:capsular exopolysaccharide synthesis family protein
LIQQQDDRHVFVESIRNIRSSLLFGFTDRAPVRTVLVTSSVPEEGKSTLVANLAASIAMAGSRVLLIDADLRCGVLHTFMDCPSGPGLAEILSQKVNYAKTIVQTSVEHLSFIPSGEPPANPGELFLMPSVNVLLQEVRGQFDYVLIDSAPLLAADDTTGLGPKVDGVLFVVRGSFTSARLARSALDMLHQRKARVLGLVYNRALSSLSDSYYYKYKNYYRAKSPRRKKPPAASKPSAK